MGSNIIQFPNAGRYVSPEIMTNEDVLLNVASVKYNHVNETLATVIPILFSNIEMAGFDLSVGDEEDDAMLKDGTFIVEAVRSLLCKYHKIYHPFQDLANESLIKVEEDDTFIIADEIDVTFKKPQKGSES